MQRDLDKLESWCAKWRIKLNPKKTKVIIFSKSRFAIRAEHALSLYCDLLSYYPHIKFLGITFDNRMTFTKHFEEILECCNQRFHRLRILVNKKWGPSPENILQIYKQCVRPIFEYGIVPTITVSETVITKIQRVQNSFIRLALSTTQKKTSSVKVHIETTMKVCLFLLSSLNATICINSLLRQMFYGIYKPSDIMNISLNSSYVLVTQLLFYRTAGKS